MMVVKIMRGKTKMKMKMNPDRLPVLSRRLELQKRFLLWYLNIRLIQDYLLRSNAMEERMLWLSDLEQTIKE